MAVDVVGLSDGSSAPSPEHAAELAQPRTDRVPAHRLELSVWVQHESVILESGRRGGVNEDLASVVDPDGIGE